MMGSKPCETPMEHGVKLIMDGALFSGPHKYIRSDGKLNYIIVTRPYIVFPISVISQFMSFPTDTHKVHIVKYLKKAQRNGMVCVPRSWAYVDGGFCDSDWTGCLVD